MTDKKILILGAGELAKEFIISAKRYGANVMAIGRYENAPGMQLADESFVCDMTNPKALQNVVDRYKPDIIVPEIESICVEKLFDFEKQGILVVPSANAVSITMDRLKLRKLAVELGMECARYEYVTTMDELKLAFDKLGGKVVVKPLMSSSGKGQTVLTSKNDIEKAWENLKKGRGNSNSSSPTAIVEEFIKFDSEITLLTVTQSPTTLIDDGGVNGETLFCPVIGHRQVNGDYVESWQPNNICHLQVTKAQEMAKLITSKLGGNGLWGVEFFVVECTSINLSSKIYFSELSPRPHDTGMVTLAGTQNFNEFELHVRTILGIPTTSITLNRAGASHAIIATNDETFDHSLELSYVCESHFSPSIEDYAKIAILPNSDFRIFGKPRSHVGRRMGVALSYDTPAGINDARKRAKQIANGLKFTTSVQK